MKKSTHKEAIIGAAINLAREKPYYQLTQADVCKAADCSKGLLTYHFGSMDGFYNSLVENAIKYRILRIVGDAITQRHPLALACPDDMRLASIRALNN